MIWDGSIKSTLLVIEMLGDKVDNHPITLEKFHDYVDSVRVRGITHPKLGTRILKVGDELNPEDLPDTPNKEWKKVNENTPTVEYAPVRDTSLNWVIVNPDDVDNLPMVLLHVGYDLSGCAMLTHETCERDRGYLVNPSEILRKATVEEILSDTPNYNLVVSQIG